LGLVREIRGFGQGLEECGKLPGGFHEKSKGEVEIDAENARDFPREKIVADNRPGFGEDGPGLRNVIGDRG
jgi:hypothetical protein